MNVEISSNPNFLRKRFSNLVYGQSNLFNAKCIIQADNGKATQIGSLINNNGTLAAIVQSAMWCVVIVIDNHIR